MLNANKVVTGNFNFEAGKFLVNAYIYDVRMKMPNPKYHIFCFSNFPSEFIKGRTTTLSWEKSET